MSDSSYPRYVKHGHATRDKRGRAYYAWSNMRNRCFIPSNPRYADYGGRGIKICARWDDFENFLADMGEPPPGASIERIDNSGNYEPGNCRWANRSEQQRNRRGNHLVTFGGETRTVAEWAEKLGIKYMTLQARLRRGWSLEEAISQRVLSKEEVLEVARASKLGAA